MVEGKCFRFKLRAFGSLLSPTTMSGINPGDEVSSLFVEPLASCLVTERLT